MDSSRKTELRHRVEARRRELEARAHELAADTSAAGREKSKELSSLLGELKQQTAEHWDELTDAAADRLNHWLTRTDAATQDTRTGSGTSG